ncbi:MAG: Flp pilus assembly protein CpaB [Solirubrobacteraceae bacterium]
MKLSKRRLSRPSFGGLLATRQGSMMIALVCAICAAVLIFVSLSRYKAQVKTPTPQATVLVSTGEIAKGTTGATMAAEKLYRSTPVAASQITPGALSDAAALSNATAQTTILPGQQLTTADFMASGDVATTLLPGQRAIAVTIDESHGATDVLQPGDHVDIYAMYTLQQGGKPVPAEILLIPNAEVIKPASSVPVHVGTTTVTGSSLVVAVPAAQAPEIAYSVDNNDHLYLALRPANGTHSYGVPVTQASIEQTSLGYATALSATPSYSKTSATSTTSTTSTTNGAHK